MSQNTLLRLLADGAVHSGESLAREIEVSRTAIWKQIQKLQSEGLVVHRIRGKGYQLAEPLDLLDREEILQALPEQKGSRVKLEVLSSTVSTNTDVQARWQRGESGLLVTIADSQSGGRGRQGRQWISPPGQNLYISFGFSIARGFAGLDGLSLVAGLALVRALEDCGAQGLGLKWPNDVLVSGQKLAGVLIELQGELEGAVRVVVGIGTNVHMSAVEGISQPWTSLDKAFPAVPWRRNAVAAALIGRLTDAVSLFEVEGFGVFRRDWQLLDVFEGQEVDAINGGWSGLAVGVDERGNYLVRTPGGVQAVAAGEISLRVVQ